MGKAKAKNYGVDVWDKAEAWYIIYWRCVVCVITTLCRDCAILNTDMTSVHPLPQVNILSKSTRAPPAQPTCRQVAVVAATDAIADVINVTLLLMSMSSQIRSLRTPVSAESRLPTTASCCRVCRRCCSA